MNRVNIRTWYGFAGGILAVAAVMAAMGAGTTVTAPTPRYSTQQVVLPPMSMLLVVTDNQTNKLYMYSEVEKSKEPTLKLEVSFDLSQTGQAVMKGEMPKIPAESPAKPQGK